MNDTSVKVLFVISDDEVTAVMPYFVVDADPHNMTCYAHVGQHGACQDKWVKAQKRATPEQYKSLLNELENVVGYDVKVVNRFEDARSFSFRHRRLVFLKIWDSV